MKIRTLALTASLTALGALMLPAPPAEAHSRHWRGDKVRIVYRTVPRYRVVYRPRYYTAYTYRPYRYVYRPYYYDDYYSWGYRYRPGFSLSIGHRGGFIGFGGGGWRW